MEYEQARAFVDGLQTFFGFLALCGALLFALFYRFIRSRQRRFTNAHIVEGTIVEVIGTGRRARPVVEFENLGETSRFTSSLAAPGCQAGQRIDLEVTAQGEARIHSSGHQAIIIALPIAIAAQLIIATVLLTGSFSS